MVGQRVLEFKEVTLPDRIRSLSFVTVDKLVCGLNSDYCIIDIPSSKVSNIVLPGTHSHSSFTSVGISYIGMGIGDDRRHLMPLHYPTNLLCLLKM